MTIENLIQEKKFLERKIIELVNKFQNLTHVNIRNIDYKNDSKGNPNVSISLKLDEMKSYE